MKKLFATLLMGAALSVIPAPANAARPAAPATPVTSAKAESEATVWVAGPFYTYAAAVNYADYLEIEYGYITEVVYKSGRFFVLYV